MHFEQTVFNLAAVTNKANMIVGLDIGTTNVTVVIGEVQDESGVSPVINIIGAGISPSRGLRKGVVINIEGTVNSISSAVSQAETMAGKEVSSVFGIEITLINPTKNF